MNDMLKAENVKWEKLGNIAIYEQPTKYLIKSTKYSDDFDIPVLTAGKTFILGYTHEKDGVYKASKNPVIIFDDFTTANKWVDFDFKAKSSAMKMIKSKNESEVLLKYIFYWLNTLDSEIVKGDHKRQWISNFSKKLIPIPPLDVQEKIVGILDALTDHNAKLTAELTAELSARKLQYENYRDNLLTFKDGEVIWKSLGEIGEFVRGNGLKKSDFTENGVGCIHYGQIFTYYGDFAYKTKSFVTPIMATKLRKAQKGDLIIASTSENIEDVCKPLVWLGEDEVCVSGETYVFKHNQNPKYLAYYLQSHMFFEYKKQNRTGTKVIRVHGDKLAKFKIPLPSLTEQERIVTIIDSLNSLINSITEGLTREIGLRQKQYEYYRDILFTFPEMEVGK